MFQIHTECIYDCKAFLYMSKIVIKIEIAKFIKEIAISHSPSNQCVTKPTPTNLKTSQPISKFQILISKLVIYSITVYIVLLTQNRYFTFTISQSIPINCNNPILDPVDFHCSTFILQNVCVCVCVSVCSTKDCNSYRFKITWGWVNDDRIIGLLYAFRWDIPIATWNKYEFLLWMSND